MEIEPIEEINDDIQRNLQKLSIEEKANVLIRIKDLF